MKPVTYRRNWGSDLTEEEELTELFGELKFEANESEPYEMNASSLFYSKKTRKYTWIDANGCSCWDGDWDGWEMNKKEMFALADKLVANAKDYRKYAEDVVAEWIVKNIKRPKNES